MDETTFSKLDSFVRQSLTVTKNGFDDSKHGCLQSSPSSRVFIYRPRPVGNLDVPRRLDRKLRRVDVSAGSAPPHGLCINHCALESGEQQSLRENSEAGLARQTKVWM